ncbi:hypothetical protein DWU98_19270 [Dyella monticola]|uniref:Uncharacterized protein n=2 Tax=Dyella monticola TaxID=1927958 RepID=A0A370WT14_9GAMM|nr:hypothetical protein DWU98_19270 [Dyella monticola]
MLLVSPGAHANTLFHATTAGSQMACKDKTVIPTLIDAIKHNPNDPQIHALMVQGNCMPVSPTVSFSVLSRETIQAPSGFEKLVEISVAIADSPNMPPDISWMMADDIAPVSPKH